mmetsp:Transcript_39436/g.122981  ORF Transcript_39436/g.122981 Transcript_39436/m.122981 type:complete len:639 (-) Transcript_39436:26-1942(-)
MSLQACGAACSGIAANPVRRVSYQVLPRHRFLQLSSRCMSAVNTFTYKSRDEERAIKTALHTLGTQHETMKLSMKVYHFQEISQTSLSDRILERDSRYAKLKEELQHNVSDLSPAQIVAAMVSAGRLKVHDRSFWWAFARGVQDHVLRTKSGAPGLYHSQICIVLHSLAKARVKIKERFYYRMLRFMVMRPELWTEFDMAWILNAMRKRRLKAVDESKTYHRLYGRVLRVIAAHFRDKFHFFSPQGIVFILYEFSRHEVYPGRVVFRAARRIRRHLPTLSDRALVALAVLLARFDWPERRLLRKLRDEVLEARRFVRLPPAALVVVLHSYAKLAVRDLALLEAICGLLARAGQQLDVRSCATAAYSLGRLGVRGPVWHALSERIHQQVDRHPPLNLALIAHAFGKAAVRDESLLAGSLANAALESLAGFTPKHLACLLDGLTLAGCYREDLFREAIEAYIKIGSLGGSKRMNIMNRIVFSSVLETPSLLEGAPTYWQPMLERAKHVRRSTPAQPFHGELELCARALSLRAWTRRRKGPYLVDLQVETDDAPIAVHVYPKEEACPITGELLGAARLRQRHLARMEWLYLGLRREEWMALPDTAARVDALEALVSPYVATRRRPIEQLDTGLAISKLAGS